VHRVWLVRQLALEAAAGRRACRFRGRHDAGPAGEPESESLDRLLVEAREVKPDLVLAVGAARWLDSAKTLAGLLPHPGRVEEYMEGVGESLAIPGPGTPWVALPTTAGTGAEATKNAVVRSKRLGYKRSVRSPFLLASCVIVDPELSRDCPREPTGLSGMDALTQLLESFVSRKATPVTRALARPAFPLMLSSLKALAGGWTTSRPAPEQPMGAGERHHAGQRRPRGSARLRFRTGRNVRRAHGLICACSCGLCCVSTPMSSARTANC